MKSFILLALFALVFASAAEVMEEDNVIVVTDDNFDDLIKDNEFILVEFYAPWCGHCKKLAPEYAKAAKTLKASDKPVPLAKCDATVQKKVAGRFAIKGYPTLKFFNNQTPVEYNGGRTAKDIVNWISKRTGDISTLISTQEQLDKFNEQNKVSVVYFTSSVSGENWDTFKAVAMGYDSVSFAHVTDAALAQANNSALDKLVLFKQFDERRNNFEGEFTAEAIQEFVNQNQVATVMDFDDTAIKIIFQQGNPTLFIFHNDSEDSKAARAVVDSVAAQMKTGPVKFAYCTPQNNHWQRLADYVGVNTAVVPSLMLVKAGGEVQKYKYEYEQVTAENIKQFVADYEAQKLTKHVKSEEIPATNDEPVKVIVGKNFQDLVINNDKDVLVKFYAPWCGHCKKLIPDWNAAAQKLEANPNIVIAKCDSTQNEIPGVEVKGFPTLKFFPGNKKNKPIDYNSERNVKGILKFLKEKTTHPWVDLGEDEEVVPEVKAQATQSGSSSSAGSAKSSGSAKNSADAKRDDL